MSEIFVGREQILDHLIQGMRAGGTEIITGRYFHLTGAGGIGKSTLARYAANQCLDAFPDGAFEFLAAEHTPETLVMELAQELGEKPDEFRDQQEAGRYLNKLLTNRKVLLLLDNLVNREDAPYLIPHNSPSSVIITTRDEECATKLDLERADLMPQVHKLEVFQDNESLALFRKVLKGQNQLADESIYLDIAERLGHLPLALRQALNLMVFRPNWSAQRLLDQLQSGEVLAILEKGRDKEGGDLRSLEAVYLLAEEWFDHDDAKTLMGYLTACAEGPVRVDFLETWCDVPELEERLGDLEARGWVTKHQVGDVVSYEQHVLVRELFRNRVMTEEMEDLYLTTVERIYTKKGSGYQVREAWLPQCRWAIERCGKRRDERLKSWVYGEFRVFCATRGHGQLFLETGDLIKQTFPNDKWVLRAVYGHQALILKAWGKLEAAKGLHEKEEAIKEELGDRAGLAKSYGNQALILQAWGKLEAAKGLHEKEEAICEELGDRAQLANCFANQALIYDQRKEWDLALEKNRQAQEIYDELGIQSNAAINLWNLGALRADMGFPEEKTDYWRRSIAIKQELGIPTADDEKALEAWLAELKKPLWRKWLRL